MFWNLSLSSVVKIVNELSSGNPFMMIEARFLLKCLSLDTYVIDSQLINFLQGVVTIEPFKRIGPRLNSDVNKLAYKAGNMSE